jgi:hypothetical protein
MRSRILPGSGLALAAVLVFACGGSPAVTVPPINVPSIPPINVPTLPPINLPSLPVIDLPSFAIPSFSIPSFVPDPVIDASWPAQIDGQPLTGKSSANFMTLLVTFETEPENIQRFVTAMQGLGVDPTAISYGNASAKVDDEDVNIQLIRFPGGNAAAALDAVVRIDPDDEVPTFTNQTIGGKNAMVAVTGDDDPEYYYINGDLVWFLPDATPEQAEVVFAALP